MNHVYSIFQVLLGSVLNYLFKRQTTDDHLDRDTLMAPHVSLTRTYAYLVATWLGFLLYIITIYVASSQKRALSYKKFNFRIMIVCHALCADLSDGEKEIILLISFFL